METSNKIQIRTYSDLDAVPANPQALAAARLDREHCARYGELPQAMRQEWLAKELKTYASLLRTKDTSWKETVMMAVALDEAIMADADMPDLTMQELHIAFKNGVYGNYGEFYGLSAPSMYRFVRSYLNSELSRDTLQIVRKTKEDELAAKRKAAAEAERMRLRAEIEQAKRDGTFVPSGQAWFRPQLVKDAVKPDYAHREKVRRQAAEILKANSHEEEASR